MVNKTHQLHDFNPGFGDPVNAAGDRTFWTVAIANDIVDAQPGAGKAEMNVQNLDIEDYFNLGNALQDGNSVSATVSFDVRWTGDVTRHVNVSDAAHGFAGNYAETQATITWSASENGFSFVSDPASTSTSHFAETGRERNGIFFAENDGGEQAGNSAVGRDALAVLANGQHNASGARGDRHLPEPVSVTQRPVQENSLLPGLNKNPAVGPSGTLATAVHTAERSVFDFVWDPITISLVKK